MEAPTIRAVSSSAKPAAYNARRFSRLRDGPANARPNASTVAAEPGQSDRPEQSADHVANRLRLCARALDRGLYRLVALLPDFDRNKGWRSTGARSCVGWLNAECGIYPSAASERMRVGYALELLPIIRELFRQGELSWSKVAAVTRIATPVNERKLATIALGMSASGLNRFVRQYRDCRTRDALEDEDERATATHARRALHFRHDADGMVQVMFRLPPLQGAAFLKSLARAEDELFSDAHGALGAEGKRTPEPGVEHEDAAERLPRQLRADALELMAETFLDASLAGTTSEMRTADRYQVMVHVDAGTLRQTRERPDPTAHAEGACCQGIQRDADQDSADRNSPEPSLRAFVENGSALAASSARRLACDCSLSTVVMQEGEPLSISRKSRVWPAAMRRAILARDQCCQWPGCDSTRFLDVHHVVHWADGGETSATNGMTCCSTHHRLLHEGGYTVERTPEYTTSKDHAVVAGTEHEFGVKPAHLGRAVTVEVLSGSDPVEIELHAPRRRFQIYRRDGSVV